MDESYKIKLPGFEGPLDLLLHLIRENKIDIYDIPIALITSQYLAYIELMKELDLDIAGEFLVVASTLIHIKSRMLLPPPEEADSEEIDPRLELVYRLLEYQAFKEASYSLREKEDEWSKVFHREPLNDDDSEQQPEPELYLFDVNMFDLLGALKKILDKAPPEVITITKETLTVKDRISYILEKLENEDMIRFESFFEDERSRVRIIVTFVAILEIIRLGLARIYQEKAFGNIWVINPEKHSNP